MIGSIWTAAFMISALAAGAPVEVSAVVDPSEIPFYRTARYTITVVSPADLAVEIPEFTSPDPELEVRREAGSSELLADGRRFETLVYTLDPIAVRSYTLPAAEARYGDGEVAAAAPVTLVARDLTPEEAAAVAQFAPVIGPEPLPRYRWLLWLIPALLAAAAIYVGRRYLSKRSEETPDAPALTPWELAYQRLQALEARRLPAAGRFEVYYVELSAISREYIEARFGLRAPEQTTPEFLEGAARSGALTPDQQSYLASFLRHCDRVKFAQYVPSTEDMAHSAAFVKRFVQETAEAAPEDGEAAS